MKETCVMIIIFGIILSRKLTQGWCNAVQPTDTKIMIKCTWKGHFYMGPTNETGKPSPDRAKN